ncbi:hemopexin repeat-containing protein [Anderseniella sp. Alg231-50]|uniref:hemopexin repeat-containing protein n=1 Tax=Anderseniella sp. Alg231-50 TaxID=1922226 RepID=UPI000D55439B
MTVPAGSSNRLRNSMLGTSCLAILYAAIFHPGIAAHAANNSSASNTDSLASQSRFQPVTEIDAAVFANGRSYFFKGSQYFRLRHSKVEAGYPKSMALWKNLPVSFQSGIDAALYLPDNRKIYFFKGDQYVRLTVNAVDPGYPKPISIWKGLPRSFHSGIDAAVYQNGSVYFFKGRRYVRFANGRMVKGYPRKLPGEWGLPSGFRRGIDAAFEMGTNKRHYVFRSNRYVRLRGREPEIGYPKSISLWKGLVEQSTAGAPPVNAVPPPSPGSDLSVLMNNARPPASKQRPPASDNLARPLKPAAGQFTNPGAISLRGLCPNEDACPGLIRYLYDVRLRSYVPPRFVNLGDYAPQGIGLADLVAIRDVPKYGVRAGCRFNDQRYRNIIRDNQSVWVDGLELGTAILDQWGGALKTAKAAVAGVVAGEICSVIDDSAKCRSIVSAAITTGINAGMVALGLPPDIPDLKQLREHGINYLAAEAVSIAMSRVDKVAGDAIPALLREQVYKRAFDAASDVLSDQLDHLVPSAEYNPDKPETWGYRVRAYSPHPAHAYVEIKRRDGLDPNVYALIAAENLDNWPVVGLVDHSGTWAPMIIPFPRYIPAQGVTLPIALRPALEPETAADIVTYARIPGQRISNKWLTQKFGLTPSQMLRNQANYDYITSTAGAPGSDWDLFYPPVAGSYKFHLVASWSPFSPDRKGYEKITYSEIPGNNGSVWDAVTGRGVRHGTPKCKNSWWYHDQLNDYVGRMDPPPRCDGRPNWPNLSSLPETLKKACH